MISLFTLCSLIAINQWLRFIRFYNNYQIRYDIISQLSQSLYNTNVIQICRSLNLFQNSLLHYGFILKDWLILKFPLLFHKSTINAWCVITSNFCKNIFFYNFNPPRDITILRNKRHAPNSNIWNFKYLKKYMYKRDRNIFVIFCFLLVYYCYGTECCVCFIWNSLTI